MKSTENLIEPLIEKIELFGKTNLELTKLKMVKASIGLATSLLSRISVIALFSISIVIFSIAFAQLLGEWLGKSYYGFLIIASIYLFAGIMANLYLDRWIRKPVANLIISESLN